MTGFLWISVIVALAIPLLTRGSYSTLLFDTRWDWSLLLAGGVALSLVCEHLPTPGGFDLGFGALVASYALLLCFCGRNVLRPGMAVILIGLAANAAAVTVNHGMPVRQPAKWIADGGIATTVRHHPTDSSTRLYWMTDVIYLPRLDEVISFGDLIIAIGLADLAFEASRRRRRRAPYVSGVTDRDDVAVTPAASRLRDVVGESATDELVRVLPRDARSSVQLAGDREPLEHVDDGSHATIGIPSP